MNSGSVSLALLPYRCPKCGDSNNFLTLNELNNHLEIKHPALSPRSTSTKKNYQQHFTGLYDCYQQDAADLERKLQQEKQVEAIHKSPKATFFKNDTKLNHHEAYNSNLEDGSVHSSGSKYKSPRMKDSSTNRYNKLRNHNVTKSDDKYRESAFKPLTSGHRVLSEPTSLLLLQEHVQTDSYDPGSSPTIKHGGVSGHGSHRYSLESRLNSSLPLPSQTHHHTLFQDFMSETGPECLGAQIVRTSERHWNAVQALDKAKKRIETIKNTADQYSASQEVAINNLRQELVVKDQQLEKAKKELFDLTAERRQLQREVLEIGKDKDKTEEALKQLKDDLHQKDYLVTLKEKEIASLSTYLKSASEQENHAKSDLQSFITHLQQRAETAESQLRALRLHVEMNNSDGDPQVDLSSIHAVDDIPPSPKNHSSHRSENTSGSTNGASHRGPQVRSLTQSVCHLSHHSAYNPHVVNDPALLYPASVASAAPTIAYTHRTSEPNVECTMNAVLKPTGVVQEVTPQTEALSTTSPLQHQPGSQHHRDPLNCKGNCPFCPVCEDNTISEANASTWECDAVGVTCSGMTNTLASPGVRASHHTNTTLETDKVAISYRTITSSTPACHSNMLPAHTTQVAPASTSLLTHTTDTHQTSYEGQHSEVSTSDFISDHSHSHRDKSHQGLSSSSNLNSSDSHRKSDAILEPDVASLNAGLTMDNTEAVQRELFSKLDAIRAARQSVLSYYFMPAKVQQEMGAVDVSQMSDQHCMEHESISPGEVHDESLCVPPGMAAQSSATGPVSTSIAVSSHNPGSSCIISGESERRREISTSTNCSAQISSRQRMDGIQSPKLDHTCDSIRKPVFYRPGTDSHLFTIEHKNDPSGYLEHGITSQHNKIDIRQNRDQQNYVTVTQADKQCCFSLSPSLHGPSPNYVCQDQNKDCVEHKTSSQYPGMNVDHRSMAEESGSPGSPVVMNGHHREAPHLTSTPLTHSLLPQPGPSQVANPHSSSLQHEPRPHELNLNSHNSTKHKKLMNNGYHNLDSLNSDDPQPLSSDSDMTPSTPNAPGHMSNGHHDSSFYQRERDLHRQKRALMRQLRHVAKQQHKLKVQRKSGLAATPEENGDIEDITSVSDMPSNATTPSDCDEELQRYLLGYSSSKSSQVTPSGGHWSSTTPNFTSDTVETRRSLKKNGGYNYPPRASSTATSDTLAYRGPFTKQRKKGGQRKDTLFCIFMYLDAPSLNQVAQVCREWREVARHPALWRRVRLKQGRMTSAYLINMSRWATQLQSLTLEDIKGRPKKEDEEDVDYAASTRGGLETGLECLLKVARDTLVSLRIVDCSNVLTDRSLWLASCYARKLERIAYISIEEPVGSEVMWALGAGCQRLTTLIVPPAFPNEQPSKFSNRCVQMISRCWPQLRVLCIGGIEVDSRGLNAIAKCCARLQVLELDHMCEITEDMAVGMCKRGLKGLESLAFTFTPVTPKAVLHFISLCAHLKSLSIHIGISDYFEDTRDPGHQAQFSEIVKKLKILKRRPGFEEVLTVKANYG